MLLLLALVTSSCGDSGAYVPDPVTCAMSSASVPPKEDARLQIGVDPRIELLSVVVQLSGRQLCGKPLRTDSPYARRVAEHFAPFRDHRAVTLFRELRDQGFGCDAPVNAVLYLSAPPKLAANMPFSSYLTERAGGVERLEAFVAALREFATQSRFAEFFDAEASGFEQQAADARRLSNGERNIALIEDYYGTRQAGYHIVLAPLIDGEGYGPRVPRADRSCDIYSVVGGQSEPGGEPSFGSAEDFRYLIWHEFSHSFVNPLGDQHRAQLNQYARLYDPIAERMRRQAYGNWEIALNEHIVRAVTTRLAHRELGAAAGERARQYERERGFVYLDPLLQALERYEQNRTAYPTFAEFYPQLIEAFGQQ